MDVVQSVKSMTSAPGGTFGATTQEVSAGVAAVDDFGPVDPHFAALNARSVAGEVISPGVGLVRTCDVFGEDRSCEGGSISGCAGVVSLGSEGVGSARLCDVESAELAKEYSRGILKTGGDDFAGLPASTRPLRFFGWGFADAVLLSFGGLPRFFGTASATVVSVGAEIELFFGLPLFLGALSTVTGFADLAFWGGVGATPFSPWSVTPALDFCFL